ncbi:MAG: AAA family ATPase [Bacteroidales bacterium]|jgi:amino acid transporter|nr:AAA family ATPase [Bacteroidales bacterium]
MSKKFGTFAGVFTPSILTILGVIMYLRLGWVVGQAGLYAVIGLILLAHVISISTGLSISSIATDKKIKTGGIYFMLSRSLGLPMGGAIGITLFVGTAFSIALYIVGFVENFISIEAISNFLGMQGSVNDTRIIGTIVIIVLVILAYISTSIAIKTQFLILGAIALSLISIIVGIFLQADVQQVVPSLSVAPEAPNFIVIFAIFFPAVTGFTAGVAMSGDLKSPKSSIPLGTLASIGVGLVIYIALALFFALYVDRELLLSDTNFLMKIAWFSPLVVAGIWGATLSSALGGLLGASRILQAMSIDRITPKFFAKGAGKNNEPRQALIFTFIIAEIGILIGELDVIAVIVTMFYIAAYGSINLAYVLERWANSDFRPSLKIPKWIGIIGFIASMGVMFKIDTLAMAIALLIIFGIYILLKRNEIQGNMSNVWHSVWTSLARSSLHKISQNTLNEKNWEPNIILFSGGSNVRTHLIDLGSNFVGDHGFISNFDLKVNVDEQFLFAKKDQNINSEISEKYPGVYTRQQLVNNIYEGIEMIAQTYGFSGVEPNTVMMGWARQSSEPTRFVQSINNLIDLDMNVLLVDYEKNRGFGKYKKIDVWWRGGSNNGNLALYFSKFLLNSDAWSGAQIRLIIVNDQSELTSSIYETSKSILENLRIQADIFVIDNEIEQKSFYDIIEKESIDSDLTFLGFPQLEAGKEKEFVEKTNKLCKDIGTVVLIKSSSLFKEMHMGELLVNVHNEMFMAEHQDDKVIFENPDTPKEPQLTQAFENFTSKLLNYHSTLLNSELRASGEFHNNLIQNLLNIVDHSFQNLGNRLESHQTVDSFKKVIVAQHNILMRARNQYLGELSENQIPIMAETIAHEITNFMELVDKLVKQEPSRIKIQLTKEKILAFDIKDKETQKAKNRLKPLWSIFHKFPYYVNYQSLVDTHFPHKAYEGVYQSLIEFDHMNYIMGNAFINNMQKISDVFETLKPEIYQTELPTKEDLHNKQKQIKEFIQNLSHTLSSSIKNIQIHANERINADLNTFSAQLSGLFPNAYENHLIDYYVTSKKLKKQLNTFAGLFSNNLYLIYNQNILNNGLLQFNQQTRLYLGQELYELSQNIKTDCIQPVKNLQKGILSLIEKNEANPDNVRELIKGYTPNSEYFVSQQMLDINYTRNEKIKAATNIFPEKLELYSDSLRKDTPALYFQSLDVVQASVIRTVEYLIEKELSSKLREFLFKFGSELQLSKNEFNKLFHQLNLFDKKETDKDNQLDWEALVGLTREKLGTIEAEFEDKTKELSNFFETRDLHIKKTLQLHAFVSNLTNLKQYIRVHTQKHEFEKLRKQLKHFNSFIVNQLNKLWYNQSSGLILARKLSKAMLKKETRVNDLLEFKDKVSVSSKILQKLPDYYKQLFLSKQFYIKDFWVGREAEFDSAVKSFHHFRNGYKGGILVTGERSTGKTFFLNQLINKLDIQGEIYHISAPFTGSTAPSDLLSSFRTATEKSGTFANILNSLPNESVLIIDDLELWWEKSTNGMRVIDQFIKLIADFSRQHLFLFACDINAFKLINHYRKIESNFINLIELSPMNAKEIKDAILKRHTSSGMQFHFKNTPESALHSWQTARLFSSYFNYSEGNIGIALQSWIAHINEIENNTLFIRKPIQPNSSVFNFLEMDWMIFIMQFILHKRMNMNKLIRVTRESESNVQLKVNILKRAGLLNQLADGILELNPYMLAFMQKSLIKRQLL